MPLNPIQTETVDEIIDTLLDAEYRWAMINNSWHILRVYNEESKNIICNPEHNIKDTITPCVPIQEYSGQRESDCILCVNLITQNPKRYGFKNFNVIK